MTTFEITPDQKKAFETEGFLVLKNAIPEKLLTKWRKLLDDFNQTAVTSHLHGATPQNTSFIENGSTPLLGRVNDLLRIFPDALLEVMASPAIMAIARDLCGPNAIPLQSDVLFKHKHPTSAVIWHQDALHSRDFPYLNIGIYLDDAEPDDGCLRCVPGTQHTALEICELVKNFGWDIPHSENIAVKAGDIIIHDMMLLHGSQTKKREGVRRTIYLEIRPSNALDDGMVHSQKWVELRKRWMGMVVRKSTETWPEQTHGKLPANLKSDAEEIEALFSLREAPLPSNCCFESVDFPGYPN